MQNEHAEVRPKDSKFLYFWGRLPVIVRAVSQGLVVGLAVFVACGGYGDVGRGDDGAGAQTSGDVLCRRGCFAGPALRCSVGWAGQSSRSGGRMRGLARWGYIRRLATIPSPESNAVLSDGSRVAVIGGGPAGSLFAYFLLRFA